MLKSFCKHWLWATKRKNIAHKIAVVIIFRMFMISYTTQNKACKTSELKLQLLKCPQGYSWVRVYQNRMKPYGKQNRWSGSLRFCPLLKVFWHATPMPLVEIHYFLCDNPIDMSSEKKLVYCIVKLNASLLFPPAEPWRISSVSGDNMESTS